LLDPFGPQKTALDEDAQMLAGRGLADVQFFGDELTADAVFDQIAVDLGPEMGARLAEPSQNGQALSARQGPDRFLNRHIAN